MGIFYPPSLSNMVLHPCGQRRLFVTLFAEIQIHFPPIILVY